MLFRSRLALCILCGVAPASAATPRGAAGAEAAAVGSGGRQCGASRLLLPPADARRSPAKPPGRFSGKPAGLSVGGLDEAPRLLHWPLGPPMPCGFHLRAQEGGAGRAQAASKGALFRRRGGEMPARPRKGMRQRAALSGAGGQAGARR